MKLGTYIVGLCLSLSVHLAHADEPLVFNTSTVSAYQLYNYNLTPGLMLGTGFDTATRQPRSDCVVKGSVESAPKTGGEAQMWMQQVDGYQKLSQSLGFDSSVSFLGESSGFGGKGSLSLMGAVEMTEYSIYLTVNVVVTNAMERMRSSEVRLTEGAAATLKNSGAEAFRSLCGDGFVIGYISGGEYRAILEFATSSKTEQQNLKASLSGSYQLFSASADLQGAIERVTKNTRTSVYVYRTGMDEAIAIKLEKMLEDGANFPKVATKEGARVIYALVTPYTQMQNLPEPLNYADRRNQADTIERLAVLYGEQKRLFNNASYVIAHPTEFLGADVSAIAILRNEVSNNLALLATAQSACVNNPGECRVPTLGAIGRLPDRIDVNLSTCKTPIFKTGSGAVCGVESYKAEAAAPCPVSSYRRSVGAQCGVEAYNTGVGPACGTEWVGAGRGKVCGINPDGQLKPDDRGYYEPWSVRNAWCVSIGFDGAIEGEPNHHHCFMYNTCQNEAFGVRYKSCQAQEFGVLSYKECEHPDFGVASYQSCRSEVFGPETYKTCRNEIFGVESCAD